MNCGQSALLGAVWSQSILLAIMAIKVHKQMREQTTIAVNGGKRAKSIKPSSEEEKCLSLKFIHSPKIFVLVSLNLLLKFFSCYRFLVFCFH